MAKKVAGGCACGSIRYQLLDKPMFVHCCHCDDCQRLTGSAFVLNAIIETQAIKLLRGNPVAVPVPRENGPHDIYRCPSCQTAVWSDYGRKPNVRFVRVGTLDKPGALKPDVHIHTRWKAKWLKLPKRTPSFRDYYNNQQALAQGQPQTPQRRARKDGELTVCVRSIVNPGERDFELTPAFDSGSLF
jgi:hypothetical protein